MRLNAWWVLAVLGVVLSMSSMAWAAAAAGDRAYTVLWLGDSLLGDAAVCSEIHLPGPVQPGAGASSRKGSTPNETPPRRTRRKAT